MSKNKRAIEEIAKTFEKYGGTLLSSTRLVDPENPNHLCDLKKLLKNRTYNKAPKMPIVYIEGVISELIIFLKKENPAPEPAYIADRIVEKVFKDKFKWCCKSLSPKLNLGIAEFGMICEKKSDS